MTRSAPAVVVALLITLLPAVASADREAIFDECQAGAITGKYSSSELTDALRNIPTDLDEYYDCRGLIRRARLAAAGGGASPAAGAGGAAGGAPGAPAVAGGAAPTTAAALLKTATPAEQAAVTRAIASGGARTVEVGGRRVSPETAGLSPAGAANVVPTPLVVALVLLGLGLLAAATQSIRSRVLARRTPAP